MSSLLRDNATLPTGQLFINVGTIANNNIYADPFATNATVTAATALAIPTWVGASGTGKVNLAGTAGTIILRDLGKTLVIRDSNNNPRRILRKVQLVNPNDASVANNSAATADVDKYCIGYIELGNVEGGSATGVNALNTGGTPTEAQSVASVWARAG